MYNIGKKHRCFECNISKIFPEITVWSESIKSTFAVSRNLKEPPSVLKIIFQKGKYDMTTGEAIKNEPKVDIFLEFLYKISSSNDKISYTLVSP